MIAVGGVVPDLNYGSMTADPWPNGLAVFDMSDFAWQTEYVAEKGDYVTPGIVKAGIQENGEYPSEWDDDRVQSWIQRSTETPSEGGSGAADPSSSATATGGPPPGATAVASNDDSSDSSTSTGAIAGGVVGGVAGIVIILLAVFFMYRRRKRRPARSELPAESHRDTKDYSELGDPSQSYPMTPMTGSATMAERGAEKGYYAPGAVPMSPTTTAVSEKGTESDVRAGRFEMAG
jgi:hypothetical protein